jgi:hypothetical protein
MAKSQTRLLESRLSRLPPITPRHRCSATSSLRCSRRYFGASPPRKKLPSANWQRERILIFGGSATTARPTGQGRSATALYPSKRPPRPPDGISAVGHFRTHAPRHRAHATRSLRRHGRLWHRDAECPCGLEVDDESILGRRLHCKAAGFLAFKDAINVTSGAQVITSPDDFAALMLLNASKQLAELTCLLSKASLCTAPALGLSSSANVPVALERFKGRSVLYRSKMA